MKKITNLLFFTFLFTNFTYSQIILLDSITAFGDKGKNFKFNTRMFLYNNQGILLEDSIVSPLNKVFTKSVYTYEDSRIKKVELFENKLGTLVKGRKNEYSYDSKGNIILQNVEFYGDNPRSTKIENVFSENNKLISSTSSSFDLTTNKWNIESVFKYNYKTDDKIDFIDRVINFGNIVYSKEEYIYDVNGNNIERIESSLDTVTKIYTKKSSIEFTFDQFGNGTSSEFINFGINGKSTSIKINNTYNYNYKNKDLQLPSIIKSDNVNVFESYGIEIPTQSLELMLIEYGEYHYSTLSNIKDLKVSSLSIFPNPTQNEVYVKDIEIQDNSIAQLISTDGRLSFPRKTNNNSIDVKGIPSGNYTLLIQDKDVIYRAKFMKL